MTQKAAVSQARRRFWKQKMLLSPDNLPYCTLSRWTRQTVDNKRFLAVHALYAVVPAFFHALFYRQPVENLKNSSSPLAHIVSDGLGVGVFADGAPEK
jgi:hypothetical protein